VLGSPEKLNIGWVPHIGLVTGGILQNNVGILNVWLPGFCKGILYYLDVERSAKLCADLADNLKISQLLWSQEDPTEQLVLDTAIEMFIKLSVG